MQRRESYETHREQNHWCSGGRDHPLEAKLERRGFVLHSHTELKNVVILGIDVGRNSGAFCGGGAIERMHR